MATRFFKKEKPNMPLRMSNGDKLTFEALDKSIGYYATDRPEYIADFQKWITRHVGGIYEIEQAEYERDFLKKKEGSKLFDFNSVQREEIGAEHAPDTMLPRVSVTPVEVPPAAVVEPLAPRKAGRGPVVGKRPSL